MSLFKAERIWWTFCADDFDSSITEILVISSKVKVTFRIVIVIIIPACRFQILTKICRFVLQVQFICLYFFTVFIITSAYILYKNHIICSVFVISVFFIFCIVSTL